MVFVTRYARFYNARLAMPCGFGSGRPRSFLCVGRSGNRHAAAGDFADGSQRLPGGSWRHQEAPDIRGTQHRRYYECWDVSPQPGKTDAWSTLWASVPFSITVCWLARLWRNRSARWTGGAWVEPLYATTPRRLTFQANRHRPLQSALSVCRRESARHSLLFAPSQRLTFLRDDEMVTIVRLDRLLIAIRTRERPD
jgi:hypothetical protein